MNDERRMDKRKCGLKTTCQLEIKMTMCVYIFCPCVSCSMVECAAFFYSHFDVHEITWVRLSLSGRNAIPEHFICLLFHFPQISTLLMFVICTSRLVIEHKSICMTTIQWHKNVNTLEVDMHRVHFYKSRKTSCANTFEWYSNRLDVYYLAFYWKVLMLFFSFAYFTHA